MGKDAGSSRVGEWRAGVGEQQSTGGRRGERPNLCGSQPSGGSVSGGHDRGDGVAQRRRARIDRAQRRVEPIRPTGEMRPDALGPLVLTGPASPAPSSAPGSTGGRSGRAPFRRPWPPAAAPITRRSYIRRNSRIPGRSTWVALHLRQRERRGRQRVSEPRHGVGFASGSSPKGPAHSRSPGRPACRRPVAARLSSGPTLRSPSGAPAAGPSRLHQELWEGPRDSPQPHKAHSPQQKGQPWQAALTILTLTAASAPSPAHRSCRPTMVDRRLRLGNPSPWLHPHYRGFDAATGLLRPCAPQPALGSLPVSADWDAPCRHPAGHDLASDPAAALRATGSTFPRGSPSQAHATPMPDTAWPVSTTPARLIPGCIRYPGFAVVSVLSTPQRWFTRVRLLGSHLTRSRRAFSAGAHHPGS